MHVSWDWQVRSTSSTPTRPCTVRSTLESRRRTGQMAFLSMPAGMLGFHLPSTHCGWRRGPLLWSAAPLQLNQTCSGIHGLGKAHSQYHLIWKISEALDLSQSKSTSLLYVKKIIFNVSKIFFGSIWEHPFGDLVQWFGSLNWTCLNGWQVSAFRLTGISLFQSVLSSKIPA